MLTVSTTASEFNGGGFERREAESRNFGTVVDQVIDRRAKPGPVTGFGWGGGSLQPQQFVPPPAGQLCDRCNVSSLHQL